MLLINDDNTIHLTRGDAGAFGVTSQIDGEDYIFQVGDVLCLRVTEKKNCDNVVLEKHFTVREPSDEVQIVLEESDTRFGDTISKPTDYWYEIELTPYSEDGTVRPQTIVGYDEDGAKVLRLYPEGKESEDVVITPEDIPIVDKALDMTSSRPVANGAVARAMTRLHYNMASIKSHLGKLTKMENLALGRLYHEYRIGGSNNSNIEFEKNPTDNDVFYTLLIPVTGGSDYTAYHTDVGKEDGYYWFKIIAVEQSVGELLAMADNTNLDVTNAEFLYSNTDRYVDIKSVTIPANCNTLIVQVSKDIEPTYIEVIKGNRDAPVYTDYADADDPINVEADELSLLDGVDIRKVTDSSYRIAFGRYHTFLNHTINADTNSDLWNLNGIFCGTEEIVTEGTDIIGPVQEVGQADFMGGVHGDEATKSLFITCDGVAWDKTHKVAKEIKIVMVSEIYRVSNKAHIYDRYVTITITSNGIRIRTAYKCLVNDSIVYRAANGGLIAIQNTKLVAVSMPNYFSSKAPTEWAGNRSRANVGGTLYWADGSIEVNNIIGKERETFEGFLSTFVNENPIRNKIYLDVIKATNEGTPIANGEIILGEFEYLFR